MAIHRNSVSRSKKKKTDIGKNNPNYAATDNRTPFCNKRSSAGDKIEDYWIREFEISDKDKLLTPVF